MAGQIFDDAPVLIIKSASGHSSLGADLLPPGSRKFRVGDYVYAGYGDNPRRWPAGSNPANFRSSYSWYAGKEYDTQVSNIKKILREIGSYYPGASGYEISGFVWWHGDSDRRDAAYTAKYEENLAYLIQSLRADLAASEAKFVIATAGQRGMDAQGNQLRVAQAQIAVGSSNRNYPSLNGNVATVDIRSSWRGAYTPNGEYNIAHYGNNAETVMEAGNAMALAMAKLLQPDS